MTHEPTDQLFPLEIILNTKTHIEVIAKQASGCYDLQYYDASAVMLRRLLETLIIECFETHGIADKILDNGNFYHLEDLISRFLSEDKSWNIGRTTRKILPNLKKLGDQSAHSRYFTAKKHDIDELKNDLRIVIEELVHIGKLK